MFELVKALNEGAETLKRRMANPISLNAGCELFIAFVTLFPHESTVSRLTPWKEETREPDNRASWTLRKNLYAKVDNMQQRL